MNIKTTIPVSEARKKIFEIIKKVQNPNTIYTLTENGYPTAIIMSAEEFESWSETLDILNELPEIKKDIKKIKKDIKEKKHLKYKSLDKIIG